MANILKGYPHKFSSSLGSDFCDHDDIGSLFEADPEVIFIESDKVVEYSCLLLPDLPPLYEKNQ